MDEEKRDATDKRAKSELDADNSNILNQERDSFNENRIPPVEFAPKSKYICEEGKDPDQHLDKDLATSQHEGALQVSSEEISVENFKESITHQDARTGTNNQISDEAMVYEANVEGFKDPKSGVTHIGRTKEDMLSKLETLSETSTQSKDATLPSQSSQTTSSPITKDDSVTRTHSSEIRLPKEVLDHFKWFMQSNVESTDRIKTGDISEKNIKPSELGKCILEDPTKTATGSANQDLEASVKTAAESMRQYSKKPLKTTLESTSQDLKDITAAVTESAMILNSEKNINEVPRIGNSAAETKYTGKNPRKRIVYDEDVEYVRGWVIQHIKDREILLKFKIMEGKYSKDMETKMKYIEEAKNLQEDIDMLFDTLDDYDKMENLPKRFKSYTNSTQKDFSKSSKKRKTHEISEKRIKSFSSLFLHLYKSSNSESKNKSVFEKISTRKFCSAFDTYLIAKKKFDDESQQFEHIAKCAVENLHLSLSCNRLNMKSKIEHTAIKSLDDYRNYINDLKIAANENLDSLDQILPRVTSVILPLMSYLSESRRKIVKMFAFLNEERHDVFLISSEKVRVFFEEFCRRHFKN